VASRALHEQQIGLAKELVDRYRVREPGQEELRELTWRYIWQQCQPNYAESLDEHTDDLNCAVFSPDGRWLATAGWDRVVRVWDVASKKCLHRLEGFDEFIDLKALAFAPDKRFLIAKGGDRIRAWRTDTWMEVAPPLKGEPNWNVNNAVIVSTD